MAKDKEDRSVPPPVPKFNAPAVTTSAADFEEKQVVLPIDKEILDLGKTIHVGRRKMVVLPEDAYLKGMSQILQRNFFPDLARLEAEEAYLDAVERTDLVGVRRACERLQALKEDARLAARPGVAGLEEFRAAVTSEDNASFESLMERHNSRKRVKFEKVFGGPARLVDDPARRLLLLGPSKVDHELINQQRHSSKSLNPANTRILRRPELLPTDGQGLDIRAVYDEIVKGHKLDETDEDDARSVTTAGRRYEMVPSTPVIRPGIDATPLMTWGSLEATPLRLPPAASPSPHQQQQAERKVVKNEAIKRLIRSTIVDGKDTPFGFESKLTRSKKATEDIVKAMRSPILPQTPRTPRRPN